MKRINQLKKQREEWIRVLRNAKSREDEQKIKDIIDKIEEEMSTLIKKLTK